MTTLHDDIPHPIPPAAYLRYKENYFFILIAQDQGVYGIVHINHEPGFDRVKYTANLSVKGKTYLYNKVVSPFPKNWERATEIGDGQLQCKFVKAHQQFDLSLHTDEIDWQCTFTAAQPTFDYGACKTAGGLGGNRLSFQEVMTVGTMMQYEHQQQALLASGKVTVAGGETIAFTGKGYRDHSWVFRADSMVAQHSWCGFIFDTCAFGAKILETTFRPGMWAREGYISDKDGTRAMIGLETHHEGGYMSDGLPNKLIHELTDVFGKKYVIEADLQNRFSRVPLMSEAADGRPTYQIVENFAPVTLRDNGEKGVALVEIGRSPDLGGPYD